METITQYTDDLKQLLKKPRQAVHHTFNLGCIVFAALMLWKCLMVFTGSASPVVVVLSGSMEPGFFRGDILFLTNPDHLTTGDIVVYQIDGREIPIVHRIISVHEDTEHEVSLLTKGDNNNVDDRGLYNPKQLWLKKSNIIGTAIGVLPYVGMITIWLNDYPALKYAVVASMAFMVILGRE
eukprot:GHVN01033733.1.p1 GENE.GHVN01033733.1~~GHVN01033733.1.p1  ORF type:complete len:181 (-),score=26.82 GHVN01033733.1:99-641(-)